MLFGDQADRGPDPDRGLDFVTGLRSGSRSWLSASCISAFPAVLSQSQDWVVAELLSA
ncbi:hypothetical protein U1Q18_032088, partial [Sarracenia purpurea var. burkii]